MVNIPSWAKGHPNYVYVYWFAVLCGGSYYCIDWLITPKKKPKEPKQIILNELTPIQLKKLKLQRIQQLENEKINNDQQVHTSNKE